MESLFRGVKILRDTGPTKFFTKKCFLIFLSFLEGWLGSVPYEKTYFWVICAFWLKKTNPNKQVSSGWLCSGIWKKNYTILTMEGMEIKKSFTKENFRLRNKRALKNFFRKMFPFTSNLSIYRRLCSLCHTVVHSLEFEAGIG